MGLVQWYQNFSKTIFPENLPIISFSDSLHFVSWEKKKSIVFVRTFNNTKMWCVETRKEYPGPLCPSQWTKPPSHWLHDESENKILSGHFTVEEYIRPWSKMVSPMTQNRVHVTCDHIFFRAHTRKSVRSTYPIDFLGSSHIWMFNSWSSHSPSCDQSLFPCLYSTFRRRWSEERTNVSSNICWRSWNSVMSTSAVDLIGTCTCVEEVQFEWILHVGLPFFDKVSTPVVFLDGNPVNRATGQPNHVTCYQGIYYYYFYFLGGK